MKLYKIMIVWYIAVLMIVSLCGSASAEIPGKLELDISAKEWTNVINNTKYVNTSIDFKYGASHDWFEPYLFGNTTTYFQWGVYMDRNHPFRDVYTYGAGITLFKILYIEAGHTCSHFVSSNAGQRGLYDSFTKIKHNHIKVGLKFNIE